MAKTLHKMERKEVFSGKPVFPEITWPENVEDVPDLSSFVSSNSWLLFDMLGLVGPQDWLLTPSTMWTLFSDYKKLENYVNNVPIINDIAERGIKLISDFIHMCHTDEQRQALTQVVEWHRQLVPDFTKKNLKNC